MVAGWLSGLRHSVVQMQLLLEAPEFESQWGKIIFCHKEGLNRVNDNS